MKFTQEQLDIFAVCKNLKDDQKVSIIAPAGSGKTSTLVELAKQLPDKTILYLAYNQSIKREAQGKFPNNVIVLTTHGLALRSQSIKIEDISTTDLSVVDVQTMFGIEPLEAFNAIKIFNDFCNSDYKKFNEEVVKKNVAVHAASLIYEKMRRREIPITHSFYLKEFQFFDKSKINFDLVFLDEAQDSNDVVLNIFLQLKGSKVFIGDPNQAIYGFRGSANAFNKISADYSMKLTSCFRCVSDVVNKANKVLERYKQDPVKMVSKVMPRDDITALNYEHIKKSSIKNAIITRTNSKIVEILSSGLDKDTSYILIKKPQDIFKEAINFVRFLNNEKDKIEPEFSYLKGFNSQAALKQHLEDCGDNNLLSTFNLAKRYGKRIFSIYRKASDDYKNRNKIAHHGTYLMTAHTSKGLEFDIVTLEKDFPSLSDLIYKKKISFNELQEEVNLYYVAITRAKYLLIDKTKNEEEFN